MPQLTPTVNRADVKRIIRRDFQSDEFKAVVTILDEYGIEKWQRERDRVQLAVLKLAKGSMTSLRHWIDVAKYDYRDVLTDAEYPSYVKKILGIKDLPDDERQRIIDEDWRQYETWLRG
jgi:hypothetical protein